MDFRLDHVVIAVGDLERTVADYRALGFKVVVGGRHPGRTSHNALVVFEDGAYIELIAWDAPGPAERWYSVHAKHGDGLMDFALLPQSVPGAIAEARGRGVALDGPIDGGRVRPDGKELKWQTGRQATFDLPFLCGDVTPRELRVPAGADRRHPNGAVGIASLAVAVADLNASAERYAALLGTTNPPPVVLPGLGIRIVSLALGESTIVLVSPVSGSATQASHFAADVGERLATRGEGPCALAIRTAGKAAGTLDPGMTHEVVLEMV